MTKLEQVSAILNEIRWAQSAIDEGVLHGDPSTLTPECRGYLRALDTLEAFCLGMLAANGEQEERETPPW
ncbi:hypothetical protein [Dermabacter jinjuensis]|uniref:Uncharacterized protein n=1 Tax=Dermabacter jinjuensis TaxID=1667168 RepID=A0ABM6PM41_9MICO|nr:hypothetical protein [Dermabacter jinjuensis]ATH95881.1 hypothetical protein COP05_01310 [Dermabacter jinjuensis]UEB89939.1 hypothetical protein LK448_00040 [Dermabacter jinjuensis]